MKVELPSFRLMDIDTDCPLPDLPVDLGHRCAMRIVCSNDMIASSRDTISSFGVLTFFVYPLDTDSLTVLHRVRAEVLDRFGSYEDLPALAPVGGFFMLTAESTLEANVLSSRRVDYGWALMRVVFGDACGLFYISVDYARALQGSVDSWDHVPPSSGWFISHYVDNGVYVGPVDYPCSMVIDSCYGLYDLGKLRSVRGSLTAYGLTKISCLERVTGGLSLTSCVGLRSLPCLMQAGTVDLKCCPDLTDLPRLESVSAQGSLHVERTPLYSVPLLEKGEIHVSNDETGASTLVPTKRYRERMEAVASYSIPRALEDTNDPWSSVRSLIDLKLKGKFLVQEVL